MKNGFTVHHNGPPANCIGKPHSRCEAFWASVVRYHTVDKGWSGVAYSFGVCPHGVRFVGRGWDRLQFANGKDVVGVNNGPDSEWYSVLVFVGGGGSTGYAEELPTAAMVDAVADLIAEGRHTRRCGLQVKPHSDWKPKACPGPTFTALARRWDSTTITDPTPDTTAPIPEEPEMLIIDTDGKPALVLGVGGVKRINGAQRNALRSAGVEAKKLSAADNDALFSLADKPADVDEAAVAAGLAPVLSAALVEALPDEVTDELDAEEFEALVVSALGSVKLTPDPD